MKNLCLLLLLILPTTIFSSPILTHTVPQCQPDIHALPIYELEVINEIIYSDDSITHEVIQGTAFLIDTNTWITAAHVIEGQHVASITIYAGDRIIPMTQQHTFSELDVSVLVGDSSGMIPIKTKKHLPDINVPMYNIGYPGFAGGVMLSYSGYITGTSENAVQLNAFVDSGMSGGPSLWCDGEQLIVYGMIQAKGVEQLFRQVQTTNGHAVVNVFRNSGDSYVIPGMHNILDWIKHAPVE